MPWPSSVTFGDSFPQGKPKQYKRSTQWHSRFFPQKSNLMATKRSLALATQGYDLMDRKRNILCARDDAAD